MAGTAPGSEVGLYVDLVAEVHVGDAIRTQTGRSYLVTQVRVQRRGAHVGRQHLRAVVLDEDVAPEVGRVHHLQVPVVHQIRWYGRGRRAG
jgi:hypothetical protein